MPIESGNLFEGNEYPMTLYNQQPLLDLGFEFIYDDCGTETAFDFPGYVSSFFRVYNERLGRNIKDIELTRNGKILMLLTQDTMYDDNGDYYYEVGYIQSGGYEIVLRFGKLTVI